MQKVRVEPDTGCWTWTASRKGRHSDYGAVSVKGRMLYAHRVAYEAARGSLPDGMELDHLCRNRLCVNPFHLEVVTHQENVRRGMVAQKRGHWGSDDPDLCQRGHNDWRVDGGRRRCAECGRMRWRSYYRQDPQKHIERVSAYRERLGRAAC